MDTQPTDSCFWWPDAQTLKRNSTDFRSTSVASKAGCRRAAWRRPTRYPPPSVAGGQLRRMPASTADLALPRGSLLGSIAGIRPGHQDRIGRSLAGAAGEGSRRFAVVGHVARHLGAFQRHCAVPVEDAAGTTGGGVGSDLAAVDGQHPAARDVGVEVGDAAAHARVAEAVSRSGVAGDPAAGDGHGAVVEDARAETAGGRVIGYHAAPYDGDVTVGDAAARGRTAAGGGGVEGQAAAAAPTAAVARPAGDPAAVGGGVAGHLAAVEGGGAGVVQDAA